MQVSVFQLVHNLETPVGGGGMGVGGGGTAKTSLGDLRSDGNVTNITSTVGMFHACVCPSVHALCVCV